MLKNGSGTSMRPIDKAISAVSEGMSQREAAKLYGVCAKSIRKNMDGSAKKSKDKKLKDKPKHMEPEQLAKARAEDLSSEMSSMFTGTDYPVTNPDALVIRPSISYRMNKFSGKKYAVEGAPTTWISDTLRVAPVKNPKGQKFIFTSAQNDTPIDTDFWENLQAYANHVNAKIVIGPLTYETNWWDENNPASRSYDSRISKHLCFGQMQIGNNFMFAGEMNTLPTAARPINDLTTYSQGKWAVYPHPRIQLLSVPSVVPTEQAFHIMSTGSVTSPSVIPRKAGIKSIFHHKIGATIVEFNQNNDVFCRQIIADTDGSFQDLDKMVRNGRVFESCRVEGFTAADIHTAKQSAKNALATFGFDYKGHTQQPDSIIDCLVPNEIYIHDVHDQETGNHHTQDDVSHSYEMHVRGRESVRDEVKRSGEFLRLLAEKVDSVKVIESNHDIALERYVREGRYREEGPNLEFGLEMDTAYHKYRKQVAADLDAGVKPPKFSMLEWAIKNTSPLPSNVSWVYDNDSHIVNGVQVGFHGFRGANGSRGTVTGYARMGHKITIGDKHTPQILDGVYCAGVMQLDHGYNKGPSGWSVSHVVQYHNGQRALITMQNGEWRG